ncbi:MAG: gamma carbonic anhydrase family protein [Oscillospiraceae bacterium]|nr:gamma carbonic anhydrase family protein [Oscillospiraceae bacterium]
MKTPQIHPSTFVAPNATVLGNVMIGKESGIFFGAVIRSESSPITIGDRTNIQDNCILHIDEEFPLVVGNDCTIGHGAILHGCTIGDNTLVGMGAIVLNGAVIGRDCIIGAGALIPQGVAIPDGSLVVGAPGKVRREVTEEEKASSLDTARRYMAEAEEYKAHFAKD